MHFSQFSLTLKLVRGVVEKVLIQKVFKFSGSDHLEILFEVDVTKKIEKISGEFL